MYSEQTLYFFNIRTQTHFLIKKQKKQNSFIGSLCTSQGYAERLVVQKKIFGCW